MPTYQYRCLDCGQDLEAVQSFSDAALTQCPACGGSLRKVYSAVGVVFKGSGFYRTDNRAGSGAAKDRGRAVGKSAEDGASAGSSTTPATSDAPAKESAASGSTSSAGSATKPAPSTV